MCVMRRSTAFVVAALLLWGCLLALQCSAVEVASSEDDAPLVFHTSLVELLNADKSQWSTSFGSSAEKPEEAAPSWTDMPEVWVEGQPLENAASLLFALPSPTSAYYSAEDIKKATAEATVDGAVQEDDVFTRAQRRRLFGAPNFTFHGLSCEEYSPAERHRHGGGGAAAMSGRCYFLRDSGEDIFFNYHVETQRTTNTDSQAAAEGEEEEKAGKKSARHASHGGSSASRRRRRSHEPTTTAKATGAAASRVPQTFSHTSDGIVWTELIVLPGTEAGVVGTESDVRVGSIRVEEHLTKENDPADSMRVQLTFIVTLRDTAAADAPVVATIRMRVKGVTGALCEQAVQHATMAQQASRTNIFNRWIFPVVYIGCLYGLVYGVAWLQARRKASAPASATVAPAATPGNIPPASKKQQ